MQAEIENLKLELRNYTDIVSNALVEAAAGETNNAYISALETAAGALSRAFSAAIVNGPASELFTPFVMGQIGRSLVESGESIWYRTGGMAIVRVDNYGLQPNGNYQLNFNLENPIIADPSRVFHVRWNIDINSKRGIGPLTTARTLKQMVQKLEGSMTEELNASVGYLLPLPSDGEDKTIDQLKKDLANLKGKIAVIQTQRQNWGQGGALNNRNEFELARMGPDIPPSSVDLFVASRNAVLNACGYPVSLANDQDGTGQREAWRRYLHGTVAPLGNLVVEAARMVELPIEVDWSNLFASDIQGRARAFQSLVGGGMAITEAAAASGLLIPD